MSGFRGWVLATTAVALLAGSPAGAMTLEEAAGLAVQTNPQMEAARENRRAQDYELRQGRGLYLPRVDLSAEAGPEWSRTNTVDDDLFRYDTRLSLTQLLFDGFAREAKIEQRAARVDGAALRVAERAETLALDTAEAFLDVMRYQDLVRLAEGNVATHEDILAQVQQRVDVGQSGVGDQQQAQSRLAAARDTLIQNRRDLRDAEARFERIVGVQAQGLVMPVSAAGQLPATEDEAVVTAINNSPTLRAVASGVDEAHAVHREATANYFPTLELEAAHTRGHNLDGARSINNDTSVLMKLSWNIFNGGIDEARRTETAHRIGEARAQTMNTERAVAEETRISWNALETARSRTDILREQVSFNQQVVETYRQEFTIGVRGLLDLLDGENELFLSRSALASSEYVTEFAVYRVLAVMGTLTAALGAPVPEEAVANAREGARVTPDYAFGDRTLQDVYRSAAGASAAGADEADMMQDGAALTVEEQGYERNLVTVDVPVDGSAPLPAAAEATPLLPEATPAPAEAAFDPAVDAAPMTEDMTGGAVQAASEPMFGQGSGSAPSGTVDVEQAIREGSIRWNDPAQPSGPAAPGGQLGDAGVGGADAPASAPIRESDIIWNQPPEQTSAVPAAPNTQANPGAVPPKPDQVLPVRESDIIWNQPPQTSQVPTGDAGSSADILWNDPAPTVGIDQTATVPAPAWDTAAR